MKKINFATSITPVVKRRLAYSAVIAVALVAALLFITLRGHAWVRAQDAATRAAWRSAPAHAASTPAMSADAVFARFNIRRQNAPVGGTDALTWQAANGTELRHSLLALEAANVTLSPVKITRSGASFTVTAERAP